MATPAKKRVLTGIKPTGLIHIGNYLGAIKPAIEMSKDPNVDSFFFMANYHSVTTMHNAKELQELTYSGAASWLALGLDPQKATFFRQSDVPEVIEIAWILGCFTSKGLMNRAHAYKAMLDINKEAGRDPDNGVNIGIYTYPVLMASDILSFLSDEVPVGRDQVQHIEMARDIAQAFNSNYKTNLLKMPKEKVNENMAVIPGLDGRKMSKSYDNTIPLFVPEKKLRKLVMKIVTDSSAPEEPKDPKASFLFHLYSLFANDEQKASMEKRYREGIAWGYVKQELFELINEELKGPREIYEDLMQNQQKIDAIYKEGAEKAKAVVQPLLKELKKTIGV